MSGLIGKFSAGPALLCLAACSPRPEAPAREASAPLPSWTFDSTMVFPADRSLHRPEDGVALPDGRLVVADQESGLRLVNPDGTGRPFGKLPEAGYSHRPPAHAGGPNGVALEPDGSHLLVADIFGGAIYRVDVTTEATEKVFQHRYGINTAVRDSRGNIWFTQSARNTPEEGEARMWATIDVPRAEGALYRLPFRDGRFAATPELMVDSLFFANGIAIDEAGGQLYLSETTGGRVWQFPVDLDRGTLGARTVFADSVGADNIELDGEGNLWIANPSGHEVLAVGLATRERHRVFQAITPEQQAVLEEFTRRGRTGEPRMNLITPAYWPPLPGAITGIILGPGNRPVYLTTLGNALIRLPR